MSRIKWCGLLLVFSLAFLLTCFSAAGDALRVHESATQVQLLNERADISLRVENPVRAPLAVSIRLELLDPSDKVRGAAERTETLAPGVRTVKIPVALPTMKEADQRELIWYRLRYHVSAGAATSGVQPVEGILALSEITPDVFELHVAAPEYISGEGTYRLRVRALHPVTSRPVPDVLVEAAFDVDEEELADQLKRTGKTNAQGYAVLDFRFPEAGGTEEIDVKVTGRRGQFVTEAEGSVFIGSLAKILLTTDKSIYQPGQALHVRVAAFDSKRRAVANQPFTLTLRDPEETVVFRRTLTTSRFGIASADWGIPENQRLGDYRIEVAGAEEGRFEKSGASSEVKISRYELPSFTVVAQPDRAYYLPGQNADVEIRADYLFGKPVTRGRVRVVRESERHWNYREQKWEIEEAEKYEGETGADGRFVARIDLSDKHKDLADTDYSRFHDLSYAAYFTDVSTGRSEQRKVSLRVTKDPIHIYVIEPLGQQEGLPLEFYLSTFYADGRPAPCDVVISAPGDDEDSDATSAQPEPKHRRTIRTNRYGVAKVTQLALPGLEKSRSAKLHFEVRDGRGAGGRQTDSFYLEARPVIRVETNKALYRAGEPVEVRLAAREPRLGVVVDLVREGEVVASQTARLRQGRAFLVFPPNEKFEDNIIVATYALGPSPSDEDDDRQAIGSRTVLFHRDRELKLNVRLAQSTYRPGEDVRADFRVRAPGGGAVESALGVAVVDKAVEERARTDREFGARFGFFNGFGDFWYDNEELAGVRRSDLDKLDLSQPLPDGLELVAEILLNRTRHTPRIFSSQDFEADKSKVFAAVLGPRLKSVRDALNKHYSRTDSYPNNAAKLRGILSAADVPFEELRDPWGMPFRDAYSVERERERLHIVSAGPDKEFGTSDDFDATECDWPYFARYAKAISAALSEHHARTGGYLRDLATFEAELLRKGIDFAALRDPWGHAYRVQFGIDRTRYTVEVESSGADGIFDTAGHYTWDDVSLSTAAIDYFTGTRAKIDEALAGFVRADGKFPATAPEFREALRRYDIDLDQLWDAWGNPYYTLFRNESRYADRQVVRRDAAQPEGGQRTEIQPVTQQVRWIYLRSRGPDGKEGTVDDFDAAAFVRILDEHGGIAVETKTRPAPLPLAGESGAIHGTVTDATGAVIAKAKVRAKAPPDTTEYTTETDDKGEYALRNIPAGSYQVRFESPGFMALVIPGVRVLSSNITELNVRLDVGTVAETVTVEASVEPVQTTASMVTARHVLGLAAIQKRVVAQPQLIATPRLRQEFPETLLWRPELETDRLGRAHLKFPLADNITTWKMVVIASTADGQLGMAEKEIRAFQPFFVEHDPPKALTEGDEITLPVVVRNYLDAAQSVSLEMKPEEWFTLLGATRQRTKVAAGDSARVLFPFRAVAPVNEGKQRVTALAGQAGDAIEKKVRVRPNGEEVIATSSQLFGETARLEWQIPAFALTSGRQAELKIYPHLAAHVVEAVEAIMRRPYGCAEQAISSAYPSLLLLRYFKRTGQDSGPLAARARRYVQVAYERLLSYRTPGGGFSYWGRGDADLALTAYALKFLHEARDFIAVDDSVLQESRRHLLGRARDDGSWPEYNWEQREDPRRTALLTAWIARVLAATGAAKEGAASGPAVKMPASVSLQKSFAYLAPRVREFDEPYLIAQYALAAFEAGDAAAAADATARLRTLVKEEGDTSYWALETNTPFYGWGLAGRLETTGVVLQTLARAGAGRAASDPLLGRGLLFLLRKKDSYGVWYSTQATINVLDAMLSMLGPNAGAPTGERAEVVVNSRTMTVDLPGGAESINPVIVDLTPFLVAGSNRVEIRRATGATAASAQLIADYYIPWTQSTAKQRENSVPMQSQALRLAVEFDKLEAAAGETIQCAVRAERVGFRGYGMMLAEIGLPPGAEVNRESLELAMKASDWAVSQYDVLPDRVILYIWPRAGGTRFQFSFRPRYGLRALAPASVLYDYYNPEARVVVAPAGFVVH
ncbi:MAG: carboxypeptidase regulatory-like domain-containing protein [Acidobacteria bacterium]|nr:carboxypeptidase regulatory-like domain-containing protein [Acidobacteriota bacterium]MBI3662448.1 carboxypeptidase regulatory-like domain-containing protein [Acidobacteriota bacterium]